VEAGSRHDPLGVAEDGLDDDRGDLVPLALEQLAQLVDVVVAGRDDRVRDRAGDPAPPGQPAAPSWLTSVGSTLMSA
jgi:hypothetical protein